MHYAAGLIGALAFATALTATAADDPGYDIAEYCHSVGQAVGGSKRIELVCRQQEERARADWLAREIDPSIADYCDRVARAVGGTYRILGVCSDQEEDAARQLETTGSGQQ